MNGPMNALAVHVGVILPGMAAAVAMGVGR
jgi:hypothetical protein